MERLATVCLIALVLAITGILMDTAHAVSTREPAIQYTETGSDYHHGAWCVDGRVF